MRAGGGTAEQPVHRLFDVVAHDVLPLAGLVVRFGPRQLQDVGQETLGEPVATYHTLGELDPGRREHDGSVVREQSLGFEALDHLAHGRSAHQEPVGDAGLDDVDVVLGEFEDALAVLLECGVVLSGCGHVVSLPARPPPDRGPPGTI